MKMKLITKIGCGVFLVAKPLSLCAEESSVVLLERGVVLMQQQEKWEDALLEFEVVVQNEKKSKKLVGEARFRMIECLLKLGRKEEAQEQFVFLKANYSPENHWVKKAGELLPSGPEFSPAPWKDGELAIYDVKIPSGRVVGTYYCGLRATEENGKKTWTGYYTRSGGPFSQSRVEFDAETFRPISSQAYVGDFGEFEGAYSFDGSWQVKNIHSGEIVSEGVAKPGTNIFDNDQSVQIMRLISTEVGEEITLPLVVLLTGGTTFDFELKVEAHEKIKTEFGEFDCAKYKSNIGQDFWLQREFPRHLVRMKLPGAALELREVRTDWLGDKPIVLESENGHGKIFAPKNAMELPGADNKDVFRVLFSDAELRYHLGLLELQDKSDFLEGIQGENRGTLEFLFGSAANDAIEIKVDEDSWQTWEYNGMEATVGCAEMSQGELLSERIQLCSYGEEKVLILTFNTRPGSRDEVLPLIKSMFESWEQ